MSPAPERPWPLTAEWSEPTTGERWALQLEKARRPSTQQFCWRCKGLCDRERGRAGIRCGQQANYFGTHTRHRLEGAKQPTDDSYERSRDAHDVPTSIWLCWCCASQLAGADDASLVLNHSDTEQGTPGMFPDPASPDPASEVRDASGDEEAQSGPSFSELMNDLDHTIHRLDMARAEGDSDMALHWARRKSEIEAQMLTAH